MTAIEKTWEWGPGADESPACIVAVLGHWGYYPVSRSTGQSVADCHDGGDIRYVPSGELIVSDIGINYVHCFGRFSHAEATVAAEELLSRGCSVIVLEVGEPDKINGDSRVTGLRVLSLRERSVVLEPGIVLYPDRSMGEEIECSPKDRAKARVLAARRAWTVDGMPGVRPLAPVRTVRVVVR